MPKLTGAQVAGIVASGPGPPSGTTVAQWVAKAREESGFDTDIQDFRHSGHWGLWQIDQKHWREKGMPAAVSEQEFASLMHSANLNWVAARTLYSRSGWLPWKGPPHILPSDTAAANHVDLSVSKSGGEAGDLGGAIPTSIVPKPADIASSLGDAVRILVSAANWLGDPNNWVRIIQVTAGVALGIAALSIALEPAIKEASSITKGLPI